MAKNLRTKVPESDTLVICDLNADVTQNFVAEANGLAVEIAPSPKEVAEMSVSRRIAGYDALEGNCGIFGSAVVGKVFLMKPCLLDARELRYIDWVLGLIFSAYLF